MKERVRDVVRTGCGRRGEERNSCGELAKPKRGTEGRVVRRRTGRRAKLTKKTPFLMAAGLKRGPREVGFKKRSVTSGQIFV